MRTVIAGAAVPSSGQVAVFSDAWDAATAFSELRAAIQACQDESERDTRIAGPLTLATMYIGDEVRLGDDAFWTSSKEVVTALEEGFTGSKQVDDEFPSTAAADLLVLDGNVVVILSAPASENVGRAEFVTTASAEWEALRPQYEDIRR